MKKFLSRKRRVLAAVVLIVAVGEWYWFASGRAAVRPIGVTAAGEGLGLPVVGVSVFHRLEDLQAAYQRTSLRLSREVDFGREDLVRVGWQSAGVIDQERKLRLTPEMPPFGDLVWRARNGGRKVIFSVRPPISFGQVGSVFEVVLREDWFTVRKGRQVELIDTREVVFRDVAFLTMLAVPSVLLCLLPLRSSAIAG